MGKRHHQASTAAADSNGHQYETPHKRQRMEMVSSNAATPTNASGGQHHLSSSSPFFCGTPNGSPALNVSFTLTKEFVDGTILTDLSLKDWRIGKPIGKGSFGEIFLASDDIFKPVTSENAKYVVKIEPHSNGPLFVEIHALLNTAKRSDGNPIPPGMPEYIASGSHYFKNERFRFLILKRYQRDLHSLVKNKRVDPKSVPIIAFQILDVLEHLHDKGYVHSDIKAENLMIGKVPVSELSDVRSTVFFEQCVKKGGIFSPPVMKAAGKKTVASGQNGFCSTPTVMATSKKGSAIEYGGSNPVRACRGGGTTESETYQDMVKSHYLRPLKNIIYRDDSEDENDGRNGKKKRKKKRDGDTSRSFFYHITSKEVNENFKQIDVQVSRDAAVLVSGGSEKKEQKKRSSGGGCAGAMEDRIHLIDFGLASKYVESTGGHRPFCMDQRRAHDGTLEFTSRDAHMGAHARRSDMECLGYNLVFWSQGFLPWKDEKMLNQPEQVHRMKEYFMTDVREMLKTIYGEECPKYLGEFLHYVGGLMYDERPDYDYLRSLFLQELRRLGVNLKVRPKLNVSDIAKLSIPIKSAEEAEITNKINHVKSMMKMGVLPFRESTLHNKTTSPKNLRSKRDSTRASAGGKNGTKNGSAVKEKKFSWSDILSSDPDQIARERAEKEFERADQMEEVVIRYSGNPTYAIRELENKRESGLLSGGWSGTDYIESEDYIKGYTKPMMDLLRKRQSQILRDICDDQHKSNRQNGNSIKKPPDDNKNEEEVPEECSDNEEEEDDEEAEEQSEQEEEAEEDVEAEEEDDDEDAEEEDVAHVEEDDEEEEADSGNDDVEEEEDEEEIVQVKRKSAQGKKQSSRGRKTKHTIRKEESDSDFINDAEEEDSAEANENDEQNSNEEEATAGSEISDLRFKRRKVKRIHFQSESSDQHDSDFNEQESSEYDSREARGKGRERSRLNRAQPNSGRDQPYSKANAGTNTKVPVIARNNNNNNKPYYGDVDDSSHDVPSSQQQHYRLVKRRKSGLRERIRPTARSAKYHDDLQQQKAKRSPRKRNRYSEDEDYCQVDESSCSSSHTVTSLASSATTATTGSDFSDYIRSAVNSNGTQSKRKSSRKRNARYLSQSSRSRLSSNSRSSSVHNVANDTATTNGNGVHHQRHTNGQPVVSYAGDDDEFFDDDDTRDMDYSPSKKKTSRRSHSTTTSASRKTVNHHLKKKGNVESRGSFSLV